MKTFIKIAVLFSVLNFCSCKEETRIDEPQKNLLVFVDLSTSLDSIAIESQANKLHNLINSLPYNTRISIYPMDLSIYQDLLVREEIRPETDYKTKNKRIDEEKQKFAKKAKNILIETYLIHSKNKENDIKSCIISSLEMAFNSLPEDDDLLKNTQVVFMTDRIEQCPESIVGKLYMCHKYKQPNFGEILNQIEKGYNPSNTLSTKLSADQVHFVITSSYGNQKNCLDENQQKEVWNGILIKQGYENPQLIYQKTNPPKLW